MSVTNAKVLGKTKGCKNGKQGYRTAGGRPLKYNASAVTVRDLIRQHLREEGKTIGGDLAGWWDMHPNSAYRRMYKSRPMSPGYIQAFVDGIGLDDFDASLLHLQAAKEAGYLIQIDRLNI